MSGHSVSRVIATLLLVCVAGLTTLAGCSGEGAEATCDGTQSCTVTFERRAEPTKIDILGITISLESATADSVTLKVRDQQVTLNQGSSTSVAGFAITVEQITDTDVIIKVTRS